jgi:sarcosine oxidase subunit beta
MSGGHIFLPRAESGLGRTLQKAYLPMTTRREVVVIGAGLLGAATAYHLAKRGHDVLVIESDDINSGASGRNAGSLHFQLEPRMSDVLRGQPQRLAGLLPLSLKAIEDWRAIDKDLGDVGMAQSGGLLLGETEADQALLERKVELENQHGLQTELITGVELRQLAPYLSDSVRVASYCRYEGHADPLRVTPAYVRAGLFQGVEYLQLTRVDRITKDGGEFKLLVIQEREPGEHRTAIIRASRIVIAAGAWSQPLARQLGVQLDIVPAGLTMNVTERAAPLIPHLVQHMGRKLSLKQTKTGNLLIGGGWPASLQWSGQGTRLDRANTLPQALVGNLRVARDVVPSIAPLRLLRSWTGIASDTPDHLPVCGPLPGTPGAFIVGASSSFTMGPTLATALAEIIFDGRSRLDIRPCDPARVVLN